MKSKSAQQGQDFDISLEAELWAKAQYWTFEDFDLLAVGLDPRKVRAIDPGAPLDLQDEKRRDIRGRLDVVLRGRKDRHELPPKKFLKVAEAASVVLPDSVPPNGVRASTFGKARA